MCKCKKNNSDIYEYQFTSLFDVARSLIGKSAIFNSKKETDDFKIEKSSLLFDVAGIDFNILKSNEAEYRYWVELYILKIIENLLDRYEIGYEEKYYPETNEKHSIKISYEGKLVEAFFLFDIVSDQPWRTDYCNLGEVMKNKSSDVDEVNIFICRDRIAYFDLANLVNGDENMNAEGYVSIYPLHDFFEIFFDDGEYDTFKKYSDDFYEKCNNIISYKTIISPTEKTLRAFKNKKAEMFRTLNYKSIANKGMSGYLPDVEFDRVYERFINNYMYYAMISNNDFADSFISAEWSYDVYSNAMGELDLTGIIAGYLKSVEQLLYQVTKFHIDEGLKIKTKTGHDFFTKSNEQIIDSTLWSLNEFVTSPKAKLAVSAKVRGCIHAAIDLWRDHQRNGYFHKHNLYRKDNKIDDVRILTIYLYFLILGGIEYRTNELQLLGAKKPEEEDYVYNEELVYSQFIDWINNILEYDMVAEVPGLYLLLTKEEENWVLTPKLMKYFYIDEFESGEYQFSNDSIDLNHMRDIKKFSWRSDSEDIIKESIRVEKLFNHLKMNGSKLYSRLDAIVLGAGKTTQLLYFKHYNENEELD